MKKLIIILLLSPILSFASEKHHGPETSSLDSIVFHLYDVISGEKGEERNWELMRSLFHPDAKLIPSGMAKDSLYKARYITPDQYIEKSGEWLVKNGFHEEEIHREVQRFGNIAHVFSTYEAFNSKDDAEPFMRGINSIQLLFDGSRWWIINIYWTQESEENPIPEIYLPD